MPAMLLPGVILASASCLLLGKRRAEPSGPTPLGAVSA